MGMAASQARYLELTARKSNVEYEGQQVNQQRTDLANQSANLFSQLTSLQTPTAPSSSDYTTVNYTFSDGTNTYTFAPSDVTSISGEATVNSQVVYHYTSSDYSGVAQTLTNMTATSSGTTYHIGSSGTIVNQCSDTGSSSGTANYDAAALLQICKDLNGKSGYGSIVSDLGYDSTKTDAENTTTIKSNVGKVYTYTTSGKTYYLSGTDLSALAASGTTGNLCESYATTLDKVHYLTSKANLQTSDTSSDRYSEITLDGTSTSYTVNCTTTTNTTAYNDALNNYSYQQQVYQKQITDINAKTSIIQQHDRTLELRLRQLDTEQQALSTEMDAVKKVIDKNIESTFKTFSS
ncbi:hypothetical protein KBA27_06075 [bacterium]|nr:hypothetical protein [bacterium]